MLCSEVEHHLVTGYVSMGRHNFLIMVTVLFVLKLIDIPPLSLSPPSLSPLFAVKSLDILPQIYIYKCTNMSFLYNIFNEFFLIFRLWWNMLIHLCSN